MDQHAELTQSNLLAHLQRKTRFELGDLQISNAVTCEVNFAVAIKLELYAQHRTKQFPGKSHPGSADLPAHSVSEANRLVQNECNRALARGGLLQDAIGRFDARPFKDIHGDCEVETHPAQIYHTFSCTSCGGRGRVRCGNCGGGGTVTHWPCGGSGKITEKVRETTTYNGQTQYTYRDVTRACNCQNGKVTCPNCHGQGEVNCGTCCATGQLTDITTISVRCMLEPGFRSIISDMPGLEAKLIEQLSPTAAGSICTLQSKDWSPDDALAATGFYRFLTKTTNLTITLEDTSVSPLSFGNNATILDYDGLVEHVILEDLESLRESLGLQAATQGEGALRVNLRRALANFMRSEIHQDMVDLLNRGQRPADVAVSLRGGLGADYVKQASTALLLGAERQRRFIESLAWMVVTIGAGASWLPVHDWFLDRSDSLGIMTMPAAVLAALLGWWFCGSILSTAAGWLRLFISGRKRLANFALGQQGPSLSPPSGLVRWIGYAASLAAGWATTQPLPLISL